MPKKLLISAALVGLVACLIAVTLLGCGETPSELNTRPKNSIVVFCIEIDRHEC